jgi:hypothetical protein
MCSFRTQFCRTLDRLRVASAFHICTQQVSRWEVWTAFAPEPSILLRRERNVWSREMRSRTANIRIARPANHNTGFFAGTEQSTPVKSSVPHILARVEQK